MTKRLRMVVGLMFSPDMRYVALIHKRTGPPCVRGFWNGIGGKMEFAEWSVTAMVREFEEETGVRTDPKIWYPFCELEAPNYDLYFFVARSDQVHDVRTKEDEHVAIFETSSLPDPLMDNIEWMIQFLQWAVANGNREPNLGTFNVDR